MSLVKSKQRVADHGEVFTPPWMVEAMLDLVKGETERIDSRFLEPACGTGNFLVRVLFAQGTEAGGHRGSFTGALERCQPRIRSACDRKPADCQACGNVGAP